MQTTTAARHSVSGAWIRISRMKDPTILITEMKMFSGP